MLKADKSGYECMKENNKESFDHFLRIRSLINFHPYLDVNCQCRLTNEKYCPKDLHELYGPRLPNEVYFMLSQGIISHQVLNNFITRVQLEAYPMVDSDEYRNSIHYLMPIRSHTLNIAASVLPDFKKTSVSIVRLTNESVEIPRSNLSWNDLLQWNISADNIKSEMNNLQSQQLDLWFAASAKIAVTKAEAPVNSIEESQLLVLLKVLEILGYYEQKNKMPELSAFGKALKVSKLYSEHALVLLELIRHNVLSNKRLNYSKPTQATLAKKVVIQNEDEIRLISKVLSLLPVQFHDKVWDARVDQELAALNSIVKTVYRAYRNAQDMILMSLVLSKKIKTSPSDLLKMSFGYVYSSF
jgi:hypothetical protein